MNILISGAGIAGPTLAYWLLRDGHTPTIVERAPRLRTGGYVIDFWGKGFDVAERMGLVPELQTIGYHVKELRVVDKHGWRSSGLSADFFRTATDGRYVSLPRGDLASAIYRTIAGQVETIFDESIATIVPDDAGVRVTFDRTSARQFDLVIGADGLHSMVRQLAFGPSASFERYLGYTVAAFDVEGYRPRDELVYVSYTRPGKQVARFSMRGDRTMFLFVLAADHPVSVDPHDTTNIKRALHTAFDNAGWECPQILSAMDACDEIYFDRVSQIRMPSWTNGRIALLGDAAFCPSLLAGEGSSLAMTAAYVLAGELQAAAGNYREAFQRYEQRLRPFIAGKQRDAEGFARTFAPRTAVSLFVRNSVMKILAAVPVLANFFLARSFEDDFVLPSYVHEE